MRGEISPWPVEEGGGEGDFITGTEKIRGTMRRRRARNKRRISRIKAAREKMI